MNGYSVQDIQKLQDNLTIIRKLAGWSSEHLGELIGVTKQTINNLESKRTPMTKTQYIAIRAILDCELANNPDNVALGQVINILLNSDELTEEEQSKVDTAITYVAGAKEKEMSSAAIAAGMATLIAALGIAVAPTVTVTAPLWMQAIFKGNKSDKKADVVLEEISDIAVGAHRRK